MSELDPSKLDKLKVADLQKELGSRGLDTKGKKSQLIARLKKALIAGVGEPNEDADLSVNSALDASQDSVDDSSQDAAPEPAVESMPEVSESDPEVQEPESVEPVEEAAEPEPEVIPEQEPEPETTPVEAETTPVEPETTPVEPETTPVEPETTPVEPEPVVESEPVDESEPVVESEPIVKSAPAVEQEVPAVDPEVPTEEQEEQLEEMKAPDEIKTEDIKSEQADECEPEQQATTESKEEPMEGIKEEVKEESHVNGEKMEDEPAVKQEEDLQDRGDKRKRSHSRSRSPRDREHRRSSGRDRDRKSDNKPRRRPRSPIEPEDDEWKTLTNVILDKYNSELHLKISQDGLTAKPSTDEGFAMVWAGARGTYGVKTGKVAYEVKLVENLAVDHLGTEETNPHVLRLGWSADDNNLLLGEEELSFGYGGTAKSSTNLKFSDYGEKFTAGDVMTAYVDLESEPAVISYAKNGTHLGTCFEFEKSTLGEKAIFPHVLTKNTSFECNFGSKEEPFFPLEEGYMFVDAVPLEDRVRGTEQPEKQEDCEIIMMVGLPACGKTTWLEKYNQLHPQAKFNILGTNNIIDKMKVMGLPRKRNYAGRWDVLIENSTKCLNRLLEIASKRKRNYILDQTNVYASARRRKMQPFEGFARRAIVIVPEDEEYKKRLEAQQKVEGKEVPESAIYEMKANFTVPDVGMLFDEVEFPEMQREEAEALVEKYREEGQKNLPPPPPVSPPEKRFRDERGRERREGGGYGRDRDRRSGGSRWSVGSGGSGGIDGEVVVAAVVVVDAGEVKVVVVVAEAEEEAVGVEEEEVVEDGMVLVLAAVVVVADGVDLLEVEEMIAWEEWVVVKEVVVVAIVVGTAGEEEEEEEEMTVVVVEEVEVVENSRIKIGEVEVLEVTVTSHEVLAGMVVVEATMLLVVVEAAMLVVLVAAVVVVVVVLAVQVTIREQVRWLHVLVQVPLPLVVTVLRVALTCRVITPREVLTVRAGVLNKDSSNKVNKLGDNNRLGRIKHSKAGELRDMDNGVMVNSSLQIQVSKHRLTMQHGELTILVLGHSGVRTINNSTSSGTDNKQRDSTEHNNQQQLLQGHLQGPQLLLAQRRLLNRMMCTYTI